MTRRRRPFVSLLQHRPEPKVQRLVLVAGMLVGVALGTWMLAGPQVLARLDFLTYDSLLHDRSPGASRSDVVIVDVDEASLRAEGQWPWPRFRIAKIIDVVHAAGARAIGMDFLFPEADRLSLVQIRDRYREALDLDVGLGTVPVEYRDNDALLAASLTRSGAVLGVWLGFSEDSGQRPLPPLFLPPVVLVREKGAPGEPPLPTATSMLPPCPALAGAARPGAFVNMLPDADGRVRRAPLLLRYQDRFYPALALAAVMRGTGADKVIVRVSRAGVERLTLGRLTIRTDRQGNVLLPFDRDTWHRFDRVSAAALLAGQVEPERLRGKIVFVGASAVAEGDSHPTPFDRQLAGVFVHAVAADALLRGDVLLQPSWSLGAQFVLVALSLGATVLLVARCATPLFGVGCALLAAGWWSGSRALLVRWGVYVSPVAPMLAVLSGFVVLGLVRYWAEELAAKRRAWELSMAQDTALTGLAAVAETRDPETGEHILRTRHYVQALAERLATHPRFRGVLLPGQLDSMAKSAPLHDIGKVGIPDAILLKPGKLTDAELGIMRRHASIGQQALERAGRFPGADHKHSFLRFGGEMAGAHHERWDGTGYPQQLKGDAIPVSARLMALADVYDALRSKRPYKDPMSHANAVACIREASGTHFDPDVVRAFLEIQDVFADIAARYMDRTEG
jgi:HD-GYP domain-containing protein (c-di-GMP phosphodiesterase class II)